jgi:type II secretory pathway component PulK
MTPNRRGFVLLTVLWVLVGFSVLALSTALAARSALATARNRTASAAAQWRAEGCLERARAAIHDAMTGVRSDQVIAAWHALDRTIGASPLVSHTACAMTVRPLGAAVNINSADPATLRRFFAALGMAPRRADSLTDAILDWRDADTLPRPLGAERGWYAALARPAPRDSQFADPRELLRVRGFERFGDTLALVRVGGGRIPLSHAPPAVAAALPGMTPAAVARVAELQAEGEPLVDLLGLGVVLSEEDRAVLLTSYPELSRLATPGPERWVVTAAVSTGDPAVEATVEVVLARAGARVAVMERR